MAFNALQSAIWKERILREEEASGLSNSVQSWRELQKKKNGSNALSYEAQLALMEPHARRLTKAVPPRPLEPIRSVEPQVMNRCSDDNSFAALMTTPRTRDYRNAQDSDYLRYLKSANGFGPRPPPYTARGPGERPVVPLHKTQGGIMAVKAGLGAGYTIADTRNERPTDVPEALDNVLLHNFPERYRPAGRKMCAITRWKDALLAHGN